MIKDKAFHYYKGFLISILTYICAPIQIQPHDIGWFMLFSWGYIPLNPKTYAKYPLTPFYEINPELVSWPSRSNLGYPLYIFIILMNINLILNIGTLIMIYRKKIEKTISRMKFIIVAINLMLLILVPGAYLLILFSQGRPLVSSFNIAITILVPPFNMTTVGLLYSIRCLTSPPKPIGKITRKADVFQKIKNNSNLKQLYSELLKIYEHKYPHNPEGVLKYHILRELRSEVKLDLALRKLLQKNKLNQ